VVVGLAGLALYMLLCFRVALGGFSGFHKPPLVAALEPALWVGRWRMFTDLRTTHTDLDAALLRDDWQALDLATVYPARWDEGPGYSRSAFLGDPLRVAALADSLCRRTDARAVRLTQVVFDKTLGSAEQPRVNPRSTQMLEQTCGR
jgi:hypothetical protein